MYWCKLKFISVAIIWGGFVLISSIFSCRPDVNQSGATAKYFDLSGYFKSDTARLRKLNPEINKTVTHNGVTQNKLVRIDNWGQELNLFIQSDINKPAWKESYTVLNTDSLIIYKAKSPELRTFEILIRRDKGTKIKYILIYNHTKNLLYETKEKLSYFPDSLYQIEKSQQVKLMGKNLYRITGIINTGKN